MPVSTCSIFQVANKLTDMIEDILAKQSKTKPLLPSQQRRFREVQLPDGMNVYCYSMKRCFLLLKLCSIYVSGVCICVYLYVYRNAM